MQHLVIQKLENMKKDPMLGIEGKYLVNLWAGDAPLDHYKLSPMYGDLEDDYRTTFELLTKLYHHFAK